MKAVQYFVISKVKHHLRVRDGVMVMVSVTVTVRVRVRVSACQFSDK